MHERNATALRAFATLHPAEVEWTIELEGSTHQKYVLYVYLCAYVHVGVYVYMHQYMRVLWYGCSHLSQAHATMVPFI